MVYRHDKIRKYYVPISMMLGPLPPLEGADHLSWSASVGRDKPTLPTRLMCDSGRARACGEEQVKNPLAHVVVSPDAIHKHPRPR
jgi:hypothetical protein